VTTLQRWEISTGTLVRQGPFSGHISRAVWRPLLFGRWLDTLRCFEVTWAMSGHPVTRHKPAEAGAFGRVSTFDWPDPSPPP